MFLELAQPLTFVLGYALIRSRRLSLACANVSIFYFLNTTIFLLYFCVEIQDGKKDEKNTRQKRETRQVSACKCMYF